MAASNDQLMRAVVITSGVEGEDSLEYIKTSKQPLPGPDDVLIRVKACGIGQLDKRVLKGDLTEFLPSSGIIGYEVSGIVEQVGHSVQNILVGDEVVGVSPLDLGGGYAEYICLSSENIVKRPPTLSDIDAAALISDGIKAFTAIHYKCRVAAGDSILILNGASSHGFVAILLAIHFGAKVFTVANTVEELNFLNGCGANIAHVIDLSGSANLAEIVLRETGQLGVDHLLQLDLLAQYPSRITQHDLITCLAVHGTWVTADSIQLDPPAATFLQRKNASVALLFEAVWLLAPTQQGRFAHMLKTIMDLASKAILKAPTVHTYPLERTRQAIREMGTKIGKIVIKM